jgi:putative SOS response-associated peptidase YedK
MCSRYEINCTFEEVILRFDISIGALLMPEFSQLAEIRPTNRVPIITYKNQMMPLNWGLKVDWDMKPIINARSETLTKKPTFQPLLENRCLVPATAYYEWRKGRNLKIKTKIQANEGALFSFAGLINDDSFTVITCEPSPSIAHIHGRMPVILERADEAAWLTPENSFADVVKLLVPYQDDCLKAEEVNVPKQKSKKQWDLFG